MQLLSVDKSAAPSTEPAVSDRCAPPPPPPPLAAPATSETAASKAERAIRRDLRRIIAKGEEEDEEPVMQAAKPLPELFERARADRVGERTQTAVILPASNIVDL